MRRLAILPANALLADPSSLWLSSAFQIVLHTDLATAAHFSTMLVDSPSQAYRSGSSEALRVTLELRAHRWQASATIVDLSSQSVTSAFVVTGSEAGGIIGLANAVALHLDSNASPFSTLSDGALQAYSRAASATDPNTRMLGLTKAIRLDPAFGLAYLSALESAGNTVRPAALDLLHSAASQQQQFTALDRARLKAATARLSHAPLQDQVEAAAALLKLTPNSVDALIGLASLRFLQGSTATGAQLLRRALSLSPDNATVRSYLALGFLEAKQFRQAEEIYRSLGSGPSTLPQLAICALLQGDTARADGIFLRYLKTQQGGAGQPLLPLLHAAWLAISGRLREAVQLAKTSPYPTRDLRALAYSQAAIWELMQNDLANAKADAVAAFLTADSPEVKAMASAAKAVTSAGTSLASLYRSVATAPLSSEQKPIVLAYALFLNQHYAEAAGTWKTLSQQSGGTDLRSRAMLAASFDRAGKAVSTGDAPVQPFIPNISAGDQYAALAFGEMRRLLSR